MLRGRDASRGSTSERSGGPDGTTEATEQVGDVENWHSFRRPSSVRKMNGRGVAVSNMDRQGWR